MRPRLLFWLIFLALLAVGCESSGGGGFVNVTPSISEVGVAGNTPTASMIVRTQLQTTQVRSQQLLIIQSEVDLPPF